METHLHQELDKLKLKLMGMFALVEDVLTKSIRSLLERNMELGQEVIDSDEKVNRMEVELDEICLKLMAREQPVARDLRFVLGVSRMCMDLERIGDQAVNIAERAIMLCNRPPIPFQEPLETLAEKSMEMFMNSVNIFLNRDIEGAVKLCAMDSEVDELYVKLIKRLIDYLACEKQMVERPVHAIMVSKCFERVADLATNIAETVVFIEKGVDIRHACQMDQMRMIS
jgi:phosphate transport system protein